MGVTCSAPGFEVAKSAPTFDTPQELFPYQGPGPWYTVLPNVDMAPRLAREGVAGPETERTTITQLLLKAGTGKHADRPALLVERPMPPLEDGKAPPALPIEQWKTWTFRQYLEEVQIAARAFIHLGLQESQSVNIWGFNAPEWHIGAMAAIMAHGICTGLYPTDMPETAAYKVVHSQGNIILVDDKAKLGKLEQALAARGDAKRLKAFVAWAFEPAAGATVSIPGCGSVPLLSWAGMLDIGRKEGSDADLGRRISAQKPGKCAAIIYTSGTTGEPKAVMISHDNVVYEAAVVFHLLGKSVGYAMQEKQERILSYLPLSHVAGFMVDVISPVALYARPSHPAWVSIHFARPYDLKVGSFKDRLQVVKPTTFLGVPLVWEKIADRIRAVGAETTGLKKELATLAKSVSLKYTQNIQLGGSGEVPAGYSVINALVLSKIKASLGLEECKYGVTSAAPIRVDTLEYFGSLGINVHEIYGMSESTGAATFATDEAHQWGSVGWAMPGLELKAFIVDAKDINKKTECPRAPSLDSREEEFQGELCFRGRTIMSGYMACPDFGDAHRQDMEKKTREVIDDEGWLHSGDKGMITMQGMVKITGRYKELIIGEGGENIAPVPIEAEVKKHCDGIAEIMMVGDLRKYNVALVTLKAVGANGEVPGTNVLDAGAKRVNPAVTTIDQALDDQVWIQAVTAAINAANNNGTCCPNQAFKIQKFTILPTNFSEEKNELTPTKKLKRKAVEIAYARAIDRLYATDGVYIRYAA